MTQTLGPLPDIKPDGSRKPESEAAAKILVAKQVPKIVEMACRFAKARRRKAMVYMLGAGDPTGDVLDVPMTKRTAEQLESSIGDRRFDDLDLLIASSGGDIHASYLIMSLLRERMNEGKGELTACVPSRAQSAATLLCLGADEILLGELGSLGPLDAQIRNGVTDAGTPNYISALHLLKALTRLEEFSQEAFTGMAAHLDAHQVSRDDQIRYGIKFARAVTGPLFARIDSSQVGYWDQMLQTGEEYGRRLLRRGHLIVDKDIKVDREDHIRSIVHKLVFEYQSHELVIDRGVLEELHLKAALLPEKVRPIARGFAESASATLIMLVDPDVAPAPAPSGEIALTEWQSIGTEEPAQDIIWTDDDGWTFAMRVGLYRSAVTPRNPWHERTARTATDGPAAQYGPPPGPGAQYRRLPGPGAGSRRPKKTDEE